MSKNPTDPPLESTTVELLSHDWEEIYGVLAKMYEAAKSKPTETYELLIHNPSFAKALFQAQIQLNIAVLELKQEETPIISQPIPQQMTIPAQPVSMQPIPPPVPIKPAPLPMQQQIPIQIPTQISQQPMPAPVPPQMTGMPPIVTPMTAPMNQPMTTPLSQPMMPPQQQPMQMYPPQNQLIERILNMTHEDFMKLPPDAQQDVITVRQNQGLPGIP